MYSAVLATQASNDRLDRISPLQGCSVQEHNNLSTTERPNFTMSIPLVRAAGYLRVNSITDVIDVNKLLQRNTFTQSSAIDVVETAGRLYCANEPENTFYWLKIITLARDSQSYNVLLTISNGGVMLRTTRNIVPGEPLLMWFSDCILHGLNIPFITPLNCNFQGSVYTCHICNSRFEYPNPLKLHLALDCSRIDNSCIWTLLASKIVILPSEEMNLSFGHYLERNLEFNLNPLSISRRITFPIGITPSYLSHNLDTNRILRNDSSSSNQVSSRSLNNFSSISSHSLPRILSSSSACDPPVENHLINRSMSRIYKSHRNHMMPNDMHPKRNLEIDSEEMNLAQLERIASDIGKCSAGYKCIFCNKIYSRKYGLRIHIRTHNGYKPLYCKICGRRFGDPSNLNKHSRLHATDNSPYKCDVCNKVLVRRRDLERHISSWHSEKGKNNILGPSSSESDDTD
nr:PREDICTED: sal-like protein 1 [Linepithema humile]